MIDNRVFYVYVTRNALTSGIVKVPVVYGDDPRNEDNVVGPNPGLQYSFRMGRDAFRTLEEAFQDAENQKVTRIKDLELTIRSSSVQLSQLRAHAIQVHCDSSPQL